jgi:hypothetical protein
MYQLLRNGRIFRIWMRSNKSNIFNYLLTIVQPTKYQTLIIAVLIQCLINLIMSLVR